MHPEQKTAVVFFAHGSSIESANEAVREVARAAAARAGILMWDTAFLEGGRPDLAGAIVSLAAAGATRIAVIPYFLTLGLHLQRDLPRLAAGLSISYPDIEVVCGDPLDGHPALAEILASRAAEALQRFAAPGAAAPRTGPEPAASCVTASPGGDPAASSAVAPRRAADSAGPGAGVVAPRSSKK